MKKSLFLLIILTLCAIFFISCGNTDAPDEIDAEKVYIDKIETLEDYVFVDMQKSNAAATMAKDLIKYMSESTGIDIKSTAAYKNNDYEILVGYTNRKESTDALHIKTALEYINSIILLCHLFRLWCCNSASGCFAAFYLHRTYRRYAKMASKLVL